MFPPKEKLTCLQQGAYFSKFGVDVNIILSNEDSTSSFCCLNKICNLEA